MKRSTPDLPSGTFSNHLTSIELSGLSDHDRALVRSIAIITTSSDEDGASSNLSRHPNHDDGEQLVGFQCFYCASSPLVSLPSEHRFHKVFPRSIESIGAALQLLKENHFSPEAARSNQRCILLPSSVRHTFDMPELQRTFNPAARGADLQTCCMMAALRLGLMNKSPGSRGGIIFNSQTAQKPSRAISSMIPSLPGEGTAPSSFQGGIFDLRVPSGFSTRHELISQASTSPPYSSYLAELLRQERVPTSLVCRVETQLPVSKFPRNGRDSSPRGRALSSSFSPSRETFLQQLSAVPFVRDGAGWSCPFCRRVPLQLRSDGSFQQHMPPEETAMSHYKECPNVPGFSVYPSYPTHLTTFGPHGAIPSFTSYTGSFGSEQQHLTRMTSATSPEDSRDQQQITPSMLDENLLAMPEDKLLLTDYFYFINQQLRICHFKEEDRNTRGGKRKNIKIGSGGIACVHCYGKPKARKFFWHDVDRLANSFSEIAVHVQKCYYCPDAVKFTLLELKARHAEQMTTKPRGWQKVFFRRMWRRIHGYQAGEEEEGAAEAVEGAVTVESQEAKQTEKVVSANVSSSPSSRGACLLAIPEDNQWLSDSDCLIRKCLEVFVATEENVRQQAKTSRKGLIQVGQVGIRCIYCASSPQSSSGKGSFVYPSTINDIYDSVREIQRSHLHTCVNIPEGERAKFSSLKTASSCSTVVRRYYVVAAKGLKLKLYDTESGIRAESNFQFATND